MTHPRVSWAAVLAGATVTLVTQLLLGVLGIAIGASTVNPLQEQDPTAGLGTGAGAWFIVSALVSLFAGGWTAGRLAGVPRTVESVLHGVLTWGIATLVTFYLLTTTVGSLIGGAASILGQGASLLGQGVAAAAPQVSDAVQGAMKDKGIDWQSIKDEARETLKQTGKPELQPDKLGDKAKDAKEDAKQTADAAASDPQASDRQLTDLLNRVFNRTTDAANSADRDALINVVAARSGKSKEEATQIVDRWEQTYQKAKEEFNKAKEEAAQKAREAGDATARKVAQAAGWSFAALLLGLAAAGFGGSLGVPKDLRARVVAA